MAMRLWLAAAAVGGLAATAQDVCTVLNHTDISPDDANMASYSDIREPDACCSLCRAYPGCVAWTLYESTCYLKPGVEKTTPCDGCTSGWTGAAPPSPAPIPKGLPAKWRHAGMTYTNGRYCPNVTMGSARSQGSLRHLASTGASWVSIVATWYTWNISSVEIFPLYNGSEVHDVTSHYYEFVTPTDEDVRAAIRYAHSLGLKVMLKPHVDLLRDNKPLGQYWRGDIGRGFQGEAQWEAWFRSYAAFISHYAAMAEEEHVHMLSVNCELDTPNEQDARWRSLVRETVRPAYGGLLTVSAMHDWADRLLWWDEVDVIGIDAYYSVVGDTVPQMILSWQEPVAQMRALAARFGKNVTLTEVGYCSGKCSRDHTPSGADFEKHAMHYEALFEALRGEEAWFNGAFWWTWKTDDSDGFALKDDCLTPQFKPAEAVLRKYYRATPPQPTPYPGPGLCIGDGKCTC